MWQRPTIGDAIGRLRWRAAALPVAALVFGTSLAPVPPRAGPADQCVVTPSRGAHVLAPDSNSVLQVHLDAYGITAGAGGEVLLLGTNNHLFRRLPDDRWRRDGGEDIAGAIVDPDGAVSVVQSPLPGRAIARPRAVARAEGGWSVVFLEASRDGLTPVHDNIRTAWYGEFHGGHWTTLERLPLPAGRVRAGTSPSALVSHNAGLLWATAVRTDSGPVRVGILERNDGGQWSVEVLPTSIAGSLDLAIGLDGDPVLAVVHPDRSLARDGSSLFLWRRHNNQWLAAEKLVPSEREQVLTPVLASFPQGLFVAWVGQNEMTRNTELRVIPNLLHLPRAAPLTIGPATTTWAPPVPLWIGGDVMLASEHVRGDDPRGLAGRQIMISRISSRGAEILFAFPSEFIPGLGLASAASDDSTIIIAGTRGTFVEHPRAASGQVDGAVREVHTELLRFVVRCPGR